MKQKKIIKQICNYEYVSFDMFDTLIKRNIKNPKDVFTLMQMHYKNDKLGVLNNFRKKRVEAEKRARELSNKDEITLDDIYEQLTDEYNEGLLLELKNMEIKIELELCVANQDMMDVYTDCVERGKRIVIVSDMYLSHELLTEILHKNGIHKYERLFVSSQIGVQKFSGKLFEYVLNDLRISKNQIVHIGDGRKNDFIRPRLMGIKSVLIPEHINHLNYYSEEGLKEKDLFAYQTVSSFINNTISGDKSHYWKIGYETFGPLLYGFITWLIVDLYKKGINKVFFLSRDGYIMQKAFDIINNTNIESRYFYASRRALIVPLLWTHPELKDVVASMFFPKRITLKTFIEKLGLNAEKYVSLVNKHCFELTTIVDVNKLVDNKTFLGLYDDLKSDVVENSKYEYSLLLEYLDQIGFDGEVAIVDIGWNGNMQRSLCELLEVEKKTVKVVGYYTGLLPKAHSNKNTSMDLYGFLFQKGKNEDLLRWEHCFNSIFETIFLAQHGSVEKYKKNEINVEPVLFTYEYMELNGGYSKEVEIIKEFQNGALDFIKGFYHNKVYRKILISPYSAFQNMKGLGTAPNKVDAEVFGNFRFYDTSTRYIAKPDKWWQYIFNPKKLARDFLNAPWRIGFMRRLFKVSLPYYEIYMQMRKLLIDKD